MFKAASPSSLRFHVLFAVILLATVSSTQAGETASTPTHRDPWLWPFAQDSIWNMPIGSGAQYEPANLGAAKHVGVDIEYHVKTTQNDPTVPIYSPSGWQTRWPGKRVIGQCVIPSDLVIEDARKHHTPNAVTVILQPDGRTIVQLEPACRPDPTAQRIVGYRSSPNLDLYGKGIGGSHFGSGLSGIGGSIRKGELTSEAPIRHALKINLWAKRYLYYGADRKGFRWPADRADSYAAKQYGGKNPQLVMGSLLAIKPDVTYEQLNIQTNVGKKLFNALQHYGAYVSDDTAWDAYDLCLEVGVIKEVKQATGLNMASSSGQLFDEINQLISVLCIIDNNTPQSIGGGGEPCMPLAPKLIDPAAK
ncbi:MAG: hypothetical protein CMJ19_06425 [Phycisphaeraceae bacterium]|nr:hypothetical protein [Phycisphaeraceae bacterium]